MVQRQIGESLFAARFVEVKGSLLDFGSGAGFPGIPIQLAWPELAVTLAESQGKKASFLKEAVRTLGLNSQVWAKRVEEMPDVASFDLVALRAVDRTSSMLPIAEARVRPGGILLRFMANEEALLSGWRMITCTEVPLSSGKLVLFTR